MRELALCQRFARRLSLVQGSFHVFGTGHTLRVVRELRQLLQQAVELRI